MAKRMVVTLSATFLIVAALGFVKFKQVQTAIAEGFCWPSATAAPEAVTTVVATHRSRWPERRSAAIGTRRGRPRRGAISADLPGLVEQIAFHVRPARAQGRRAGAAGTRSRSARSSPRRCAQLDLTQAQLPARHRPARPAENRGAVGPRSGLGRGNKQAAARVGEIRAAIERKTIRAPFSGVLGIRNVNLGEYLAGGAPIVSLQSLQPVYVHFTVPQQEVAALRTAGAVRVTSDGFEGTEKMGKVTAVDSMVDQTMRNMRVQAIFENRDGRMRPGMFVETALARGGNAPVLTVPASAVSYAPFGDSLFIVEDVKGCRTEELSRRTPAIREARRRARRPGGRA